MKGEVVNEKFTKIKTLKIGGKFVSINIKKIVE